MNPFGIGSVLTAVSSFGFGLLVFVRSSNRQLAKRWFIFVSSVAIWGVFGVWISEQRDAHTALVIWRLGHAFAAIWIAPLFYHFVSDFLGQTSRRSIRFHYGIALFCACMAPAHDFIPYTKWVTNVIYVAQAGWFYSFYSVWWWGLVIYSHFLLARAQRTASEGKKNQIRYFFLATALGFSGGILNYLPIYGFNVYPWGQCMIPLYPLIMSYAILKHHLMDVQVVIRKTLVYSAATLSLTVIYVAVLIFITKAFEGWNGAPHAYSSAVAAAVIAILFQPVRSRIQNWMDRHFPREALNQAILREATGRFVHEIKRPLANISMPAQLALMNVEAIAGHPEEFERVLPKLREQLKYIVNESLKAGEKIEAISHLSTQTSAAQDPVNLRDLLTQALAQEQTRIDRENIKLILPEPKTDFWTLGDAMQLKIALANVIKNAIDSLARTDSARCLRFGFSRESDWIAIDIEDSGAGIAAHDLAHLFDPWFTTKGSGGMGIGLYLTKEILRLHGASIEVKSHPGATTFRFLFRKALM